MSKTADFVLIVSDKKTTRMMQAADVWEKGRVVGQEVTVTANFKDDVDLTLERAFQVFGNGLADAEREIIYAELLVVNDNGKTTRNDKVCPYFKSGIGTVSDGEKFFLLSEYIRGRGFEVETGNLAVVESVELPKEMA